MVNGVGATISVYITTITTSQFVVGLFIYYKRLKENNNKGYLAKYNKESPGVCVDTVVLALYSL